MRKGEKMELPKRKRNRLKYHDYGAGGAYFITICTKDRKNVFWENAHAIVGEDSILPQIRIPLSQYGKLAEDTIQAIPTHYHNVRVDRYVIMPNHIHLILFLPYRDGRMISAPTVSSIIGQTKRYISKQIGKDIWQKSFHDHVIRGEADYEKIVRYICENPMRWESDCFYEKI